MRVKLQGWRGRVIISLDQTRTTQPQVVLEAECLHGPAWAELSNAFCLAIFSVCITPLMIYILGKECLVCLAWLKKIGSLI